MGSFPIARVLGIPIRLHPTLLLVPVLAVWSARTRSENLPAVLVLIGAVFGCVALHELGHALAARRFGVRVVDITLYPIGGVARLTSLPSPSAEWRIALAGPLVNLGLATLLAASSVVRSPSSIDRSFETVTASLAWINLSLFLFNLFPAYPMDGGRLLRAVLALRQGRGPATVAAVRVGQALALLLAATGLALADAWLVLLGGVVFVGAFHQASAERWSPPEGLRTAREAMVTAFATLPPDALLADAARIAVDTAQREFPVLDERGRVLGLVSHRALLEGLAQTGPQTPVREAMVRDAPEIGPDEDLGGLRARSAAQCRMPVLVIDRGRLVGIVPPELLHEQRRLDTPHPPPGQRSHSQM